MRGTEVLEMTETEQSFTFEGLASKPVPSILREFSARSSWNARPPMPNAPPAGA